LSIVVILGPFNQATSQITLKNNEKKNYRVFKPSSSNQPQIKDMVVKFSNLIFNQMSPLEAYKRYVFMGSLTKEESKYFQRNFLKLKKTISPNLKIRYLSVVFAKEFPKLYLVLGKKDFSNDLSSLSDNFYSLLSASEKEYYDNLVKNLLIQEKLSKKEFEDFFNDDGKSITEAEITKMEKIFSRILLSIKSQLNKEIYNKNLKTLNLSWKITNEQLDKKEVYLSVLKPLLAFVVSLKNNSPKIIEFPEYID